LSARELPAVHLVVLLLQLAHLLDFVQINDKAGIHVVQILYAFAAKNRGMLTAVKVLNPLLVFLAHVHGAISFVRLIVLVCIGVRLKTFLKVDCRKKGILSDNLV